MIGFIIVSLIISMSWFNQSAIATPAGCEENLTRTSYVRLVALAYSQRLIDLSQIDALLRSSQPQNPVESLTPRPETVALNKAFATTVARLGTQQWPALKAELQKWLATINGEQREAENARKTMRPIFSPNRIATAEKVPGRDVPFFYADQTGAYFSASLGAIGTEGVVEFWDYSSQTSAKVSIGPLWSSRPSWMLTPDHLLRLASLSTPDQIKVVEFLDRKKLREVLLKLKVPAGYVNHAKATFTPSNWLVTQSGQTLIAASNFNSIQVFDFGRSQDPICFFPAAVPDYSSPIQLFETKSGQILLSFIDSARHLHAFELTNPEKPIHILNESQPSVINQPAWFESQDGTVYLSAQSGGVFSIFTPLGPVKKYFAQKVLPAGLDENFWYHAENGHDLVYASSLRSLLTDERLHANNAIYAIRISVFDATTKTLLNEKESHLFGVSSPWIIDQMGHPRIFVTGNLNQGSVFLIDPIDPTAPIETVHMKGVKNLLFTPTLAPIANAPNTIVIVGPTDMTLLRLFNSVKP